MNYEEVMTQILQTVQEIRKHQLNGSGTVAFGTRFPPSPPGANPEGAQPPVAAPPASGGRGRKPVDTGGVTKDMVKAAYDEFLTRTGAEGKAAFKARFNVGGPSTLKKADLPLALGWLQESDGVPQGNPNAGPTPPPSLMPAFSAGGSPPAPLGASPAPLGASPAPLGASPAPQQGLPQPGFSMPSAPAVPQNPFAIPAGSEDAAAKAARAQIQAWTKSADPALRDFVNAVLSHNNVRDIQALSDADAKDFVGACLTAMPERGIAVPAPVLV